MVLEYPTNSFFRSFWILTIIFFTVSSFSAANKGKKDSLLSVIKSTSVSDTSKITAFNALSREYFSNKPDTSLILLRTALPIAQKSDNKRLYSFTCIYMANAFLNLSLFDSAIVWYNKGYEIGSKGGIKKNQAGALMGLGNIYNTIGDYEKAISFYTKGLVIQEEIRDSAGMANSYTGLGVIFEQQDEFNKALEYQLKAIKIKEIKKNKPSLATSYNNVGIIKASLKKYDEALEYYFKALKIFEDVNSLNNVAMVSSNIGNSYSEKKNKKEALSYKKKAYLIYKQIGNENGMAAQLMNLGIEYCNFGQHEQGIASMLESEKMARQLNAEQLLLDCYHSLYNVYILNGSFENATNYSIKYIDLYKKIYNAEKAKQIDELNTKYETDKRTKEIEILNKDKKISNLLLLENKNKLNKQRIIILSSVAAAVLLILLVFLLFNRNKLKQKTNEQLQIFNKELQTQKHLVEEKQKEIVDSITYARRLQHAILPGHVSIKNTLEEKGSDFFILFKPKDIVAGDFYFFEKKNNTLFFAAADCTGHGVPGAMVSVVCSTALTRSVLEFNLSDTGEILGKTRELVLETFSKSESVVQDGMDISFLNITYTAGNEARINWSGANNGLMYVQNSLLKEIKADKQPIGKSEQSRPFKQNSLSLSKGDTLYLLTDGYPDQFGGPHGKKFKYKQFEELLFSIHDLPMQEQMKILDKRFEEWKGKLEQVDDVCVIGIRL